MAIIIAEKDKVVPDEILKRLFISAKNAKRRLFHTIPKSSYEILSFLQQSNLDRAFVANLIRNCQQDIF